MENLKIPDHVGVIIDGNRRWARKRGMRPWKGHRHGMDTLEKFFENCLDLGVSEISAYVLSTENLKRSQREVKELFKLFKEYSNKWDQELKEDKSLLEKYEVQVRFFGNFKKLPSDLVNSMKKVMKKTKKYHKRILNILICYGGRFEITEMVKKMVDLARRTGRIKITEKTVQENLFVKNDVDLLIRTGGMKRLSNFLPWQMVYTEFYFTETLWPDFDKKELMKAVKWFTDVKRNFGK